MQVQDMQASNAAQRYVGMWPSLRRIYAEEGWLGLFKGNGTNVARVAPSAAVRFSSFEFLKTSLLTRKRDASKHADGTQVLSLSTIENAVAGAGAGLVSTVTTYPLDMLRSRLSVGSAHYKGLFSAMSYIAKTEGIPAFFRGVSTSVYGM